MVLASVPLLVHRVSVLLELSTTKARAPLTLVKRRGEVPWPRSLTSVVVLPSLFHSAGPFALSGAVKASVPPTFSRLDAPAWRKVAVLPSNFHSPLLVPSVAVKKRFVPTAVRLPGFEPLMPKLRSVTSAVSPVVGSLFH